MNFLASVICCHTKIFSGSGGHGGMLVGIMFAEAICVYIPVKLHVLCS